MKYVRLKGPMPESLADWEKKAQTIREKISKETDCQKKKLLIKQNQRHWRDPALLSFLKELSDNKCWFTEAKFTAEYPHLEHFRPKSCARNEHGERCHDGYWWLAFDLENYRLSKPMPNCYKGTYFPIYERALAVCKEGVAVSRELPMLLDPIDEEDVDMLSFNSMGEPEPNPHPALEYDDWDRQRIEFSITRYGLDHTELCTRRKELWNEIANQINQYTHYAQKAKKLRCIESAGRARAIKLQLAEYLDPSREFTSLVRACFRHHSCGEAILNSLPQFRKAA